MEAANYCRHQYGYNGSGRHTAPRVPLEDLKNNFDVLYRFAHCDRDLDKDWSRDLHSRSALRPQVAIVARFQKHPIEATRTGLVLLSSRQTPRPLLRYYSKCSTHSGDMPCQLYSGALSQGKGLLGIIERVNAAGAMDKYASVLKSPAQSNEKDIVVF
ncbi:hypothetical protein EVAR_75518_1 [Eumeta japonica]|uniref:Uncharacterized protein n=1 Tax=Eumeta variegata TaxID=151549 RepID=A0A4C1UK91_EUMVA|nr:hypothetical protein EVAR_75518_1 [Eumeta japonica]